MARLAVIAIVICAAVLYGYRLGYAPPHVEIDEVLIALDAHAIATTGRDMRGELLPLYSQTAEHSWYQPFVIYVTALALSVMPFTEWSIRVPTVCIGVLDVLLIFLVARQLFSSGLFGAIAAGMLALTPAHFIHSRYGMDYIYPVPFILGWLLCLSHYAERRSPRLLVLGSVILGLGFYSYIASVVMMPMYVALTCLLLYQQSAPRRAYALATAGFLPWLIPFLVWIARHPSAYAATVEKYGLYDANRLDAMQGLRSAFGFVAVSERLSQYWSFYDPSFLFFGSGTKLMFSTNLAGVFLIAFAVFLAIGIFRVVRHRSRPIDVLILLGFVTAPLAALIVVEDHPIFRALGLLPFGVLLATSGVHALWYGLTTAAIRAPFWLLAIAAGAIGGTYAAWTLLKESRLSSSPLLLIAVAAGCIVLARTPDAVRQWRLIAVALLALLPLQFSRFWSDYFSDYRVRSAYWLGGNIAGAMEDIIDRDRRESVPAVYFNTLRATSGQVDGREPYIEPYWKFYLTKHHKEDLLSRTRRFDAAAVKAMPAGSLVFANEGEVTSAELVKNGELRKVTSIPELNGSSFFVILQR